MYKCECGREFSSSQSLNGHKGHCKIHLGDQRYKELADTTRKNQIKATQARSEQLSQQSLDWEKLWILEHHTCEQCGRVMTAYYGSGRFCSKSCSVEWVALHQSAEAKSRKVEVGINNLKHDGTSGAASREFWTQEARAKQSSITREVMKNPEIRKKISDKLRGRILSKETRKKISAKVKLSHEDGRNKGWTTRRNQESYAESFWKSVLENNGIPYEQEKKIHQSDLGMNTSHFYFLDFYLPDKNVDLEIDGHQHYEESRKSHDIIRDKYLIDAGYLVYRIKYVNPSNTLRVQEDINNFLSWYNNLGGANV